MILWFCSVVVRHAQQFPQLSAHKNVCKYREEKRAYKVFRLKTPHLFTFTRHFSILRFENVTFITCHSTHKIRKYLKKSREIFHRRQGFVNEIAGKTEGMHGEIYRRTKDFICEIAGETEGMHGEIYRQTKDFICEIAGETEGMRREILV